MVLQFVGFMAAFRHPGALSPLLAGTWAVCSRRGLPSRHAFSDISWRAVCGKLRRVRALNAALSAITAAVVGVILNLAVWFGIHTVFGATVPADRAIRVRRPGSFQSRSVGARAFSCGRRGDLPLQGGHDPDTRIELRGGYRPVPRWCNRLAKLASLHAQDSFHQRFRICRCPFGSIVCG